MDNVRYLNRKNPEILSFSSGKGGVGKTLSVINFAFYASCGGKKVLIIDGDLGMSNVDVLLNLSPQWTLVDLIDRDDLFLEDLLLEGPLGIKVLPSGSGVSQIQQMSFLEKQLILNKISSFKTPFDLVLVDTGAGIGSNVINLNRLSQHRFIITSPDPHAITDAYAIMKVLSQEYNIRRFSLLVNTAYDAFEAKSVYHRICDVAKEKLLVNLEFAGWIPKDSVLSDLIVRRNVVPECLDKTIAGQAWRKITEDFLEKINSSVPQGTENIFTSMIALST